VIIQAVTKFDQGRLRNFECYDGSGFSQRVEEIIQGVLFKRWKKRRKSKDPLFINLAEFGEEVVGVQAYSPFPDEDGLAGSWVLAVSVDWRRNKIGTNLKLEAMNHAKELGAVGIASFVKPDNNAMNGLNNQWKLERRLDTGTEKGYLATVIKL